MKKITIIQPDDWHVHFRDEEMLKLVVPETDKIFGKCIVMPNLVPPIINNRMAIEYQKNKKLYKNKPENLFNYIFNRKY